MSVSLDFIAAQLQRVLEGQQQVREDMAQMRADLAALRRDFESRSVQQNDEMTVLTGMVLRYASEHIAWGGVQNQLRRLTERIDALERQAP